MPKNSSIEKWSHSRVQRVARSRAKAVLEELANTFRTRGRSDNTEISDESSLDELEAAIIAEILVDPATAKKVANDLAGETLRIYRMALADHKMVAPSTEDIILSAIASKY